ncbi:hypothetical protein V7157_18325 [Neobacillus drentensis]|uniref:hypothetical protein n=1 Tax=Neobacillus drentensis TaxID=220684 RepID=UPI00300160E1
MDNKKKPSFWNSFLFNKSLKNEEQEDGVKYVNLGSETTLVRVVQTEHEIILQSKDDQKGEWVTKYKKTKIAPKDYRISSGYFKLVKQNVVILSTWMGSGGYLDYTIIGRRKGKIVELVDTGGVYKGDIFFEDGKLLVKSTNRYSIWVIKDDRLMLIPYKIPKISGALQIEYYLFPDGRVKVEKNHYIVPVGTIVQFIRADLNESPWQGYFNEDEQSIEMIEDFPDLAQAFKIVKKGKVEGKIIPDSHRDKGITITIVAE